MTDWPYKFFTRAEFACKHTGKCDMDPAFMRELEALRVEFDAAMRVTSGYRDPSHPEEAKKDKPGTHAQGIACDVAVRGEDAVRLIALAYKRGFRGIGVQQKGNVRFIHLDRRPGEFAFWSY